MNPYMMLLSICSLEYRLEGIDNDREMVAVTSVNYTEMPTSTDLSVFRQICH